MELWPGAAPRPSVRCQRPPPTPEPLSTTKPFSPLSKSALKIVVWPEECALRLTVPVKSVSTMFAASLAVTVTGKGTPSPFGEAMGSHWK